LKNNLPLYVSLNYSNNEIEGSNYHLPGYIMIKFRSKEGNIDEAHEVLKIALNSKEWNVI
jgi:hypothetical protein